MGAITSSNAWERFGEPFYLTIMDGFPYESTEDYQAVNGLQDRMMRVAPLITDLVVRAMWNTGWRQALMASWWAGVHRFPDLDAAENIQAVLRPSFRWYGYDGFVHFAALALIGGEVAKEVVSWALDSTEFQGLTLYPQCAALLLEMRPYSGFTEEETLTIGRFSDLVKLGRRIGAGLKDGSADG